MTVSIRFRHGEEEGALHLLPLHQNQAWDDLNIELGFVRELLALCGLLKAIYVKLLLPQNVRWGDCRGSDHWEQLKYKLNDHEPVFLIRLLLSSTISDSR